VEVRVIASHGLQNGPDVCCEAADIAGHVVCLFTNTEFVMCWARESTLVAGYSNNG